MVSKGNIIHLNRLIRKERQFPKCSNGYVMHTGGQGTKTELVTDYSRWQCITLKGKSDFVRKWCSRAVCSINNYKYFGCVHLPQHSCIFP